MGATIWLDEICGLAAQVISALDAEPYRTAPDVTPAWHEAWDPFGVAGEPEGQAHLAFALLPQGAVQTGGDRMGREVELVTDLGVAFRYLIRPDAQVSDLRAAMRAAHDLARALSRDCWLGPWGRCRLISGWELASTPQDSTEPYIDVRLRFEIHYDTEI